MHAVARHGVYHVLVAREVLHDQHLVRVRARVRVGVRVRVRVRVRVGVRIRVSTTLTLPQVHGVVLGRAAGSRLAGRWEEAEGGPGDLRLTLSSNGLRFDGTARIDGKQAAQRLAQPEPQTRP